jgi:hypothetical protein
VRHVINRLLKVNSQVGVDAKLAIFLAVSHHGFHVVDILILTFQRQTGEREREKEKEREREE